MPSKMYKGEAGKVLMGSKFDTFDELVKAGSPKEVSKDLFYQIDIKSRPFGLRVFVKSPLIHSLFAPAGPSTARVFGLQIFQLPLNIHSSHMYDDGYTVSLDGTRLYEDGICNLTWLRAVDLDKGVTFYTTDVAGGDLAGLMKMLSNKLGMFYRSYLMTVQEREKVWMVREKY